jgi:hypothetical protein
MHFKNDKSVLEQGDAKNSKPMFNLNQDEIKELWKHTKDDPDLFNDIFDRFRKQCGDWIGSPRIRDRGVEEDPHLFHSHVEGYNCLAKQATEEPAWIEGATGDDEAVSNAH